MKDKWKGFIIFGSIMLLVIAVVIPGVIYSSSRASEKIDEGIVTNKRTEQKGGWGSGTSYIVEINNNTEYTISLGNYALVSVGDFVYIYMPSLNEFGIRVI